jgi:hypothetical protein
MKWFLGYPLCFGIISIGDYKDNKASNFYSNLYGMGECSSTSIRIAIQTKIW